MKRNRPSLERSCLISVLSPRTVMEEGALADLVDLKVVGDDGGDDEGELAWVLLLLLLLGTTLSPCRNAISCVA